METARELAAGFEKRRAGRVDAGDVKENLAELAAAGVTVAAIKDAVGRRSALRAVASGCGVTAFKLAETFSAGQAYGTLYDAAVRLGLAERAYEIAVERAKARGIELTGLPGTQFAVARMRSSLATMVALLDRQALRAAADGAVGLAEACVANLYVAPEADSVVATAFGVLSGDSEGTARLSQIWHDLKAVSAPVSGDLARELVGKNAVGIDPTETPRWL
ncbi:acyl-CoA dehydrogenase family protein [Actinokineospora sp. HUAS TT18]|uniref:acyl-CoA dehydrogenase family protein n=1 Tax=Actinokineospora sp. HUAS TT18 TaxID=3447451 RepID=UPI003F51BEF6